MHLIKFLVFLVLTVSFNALAEDEGKIGFTGKIGVDGFFSPEITSFIVEEVKSNSPAEKAGILAGQTILSIDGCKIPGCSANKAKKSLKNRKPGDILTLLIEKQNGTQVLIDIHIE